MVFLLATATQFLLIALLVMGVLLGTAVGYLFLRARQSNGAGELSQSERAELRQRDREIAAIRDRIEEMYQRQAVGSDTQTAILNQQMEHLQHHIQARGRQIEGLQSQLRYEMQQRDEAISELRAQLTEAVRAITTAGALPPAAVPETRPLLSAAETPQPVDEGHDVFSDESEADFRQPGEELFDDLLDVAASGGAASDGDDDISWINAADDDDDLEAELEKEFALDQHSDPAHAARPLESEVTWIPVDDEHAEQETASIYTAISQPNDEDAARWAGVADAPSETRDADYGQASDQPEDSDAIQPTPEESFSWEPVELEFDDAPDEDEADGFLSLFDDVVGDIPDLMRPSLRPAAHSPARIDDFVAGDGVAGMHGQAYGIASGTVPEDFVQDEEPARDDEPMPVTFSAEPEEEPTYPAADAYGAAPEEEPPGLDEDPLAGLVQWTHGGPPDGTADEARHRHTTESPSPHADDSYPEQSSIGGDGSSSSVEPTPGAPAIPPGADDLTLLPMITAERQQLLYGLGVHHVEEIARWSRAEARRVADAVRDVSEETIMNEWVFAAQSILFDRYQAQLRERRVRPT
jgi:predicted flap endonuclease-1-like 5' DNA nuclease